MFAITDIQKIGVGIAGFGISFLFLGVLLFFDKGLLAIGNGLIMFAITDIQKIGVGIAGFGISFLFLGVLLFFDKGLLAIGNILFLSGLACVIGIERTIKFFFQKHKIKASISFFGGIGIVLFGYPLIGMLFETYGFFLLFSGFFPIAINFLRRIPILGTILNMPLLNKIIDRFAGEATRTTV